MEGVLLSTQEAQKGRRSKRNVVNDIRKHFVLIKSSNHEIRLIYPNNIQYNFYKFFLRLLVNLTVFSKVIVKRLVNIHLRFPFAYLPTIKINKNLRNQSFITKNENKLLIVHHKSTFNFHLLRTKSRKLLKSSKIDLKFREIARPRLKARLRTINR
jgi:hypothetical protein